MNIEELTPKEFLGKELCCVCGPQHFPSGEPIDDVTGDWHNEFERVFLPLGEWKTGQNGSL